MDKQQDGGQNSDQIEGSGSGDNHPKDTNTVKEGQVAFTSEQESQAKSWIASALVEALAKTGQSNSSTTYPPSSQNTTQQAKDDSKLYLSTCCVTNNGSIIH